MSSPASESTQRTDKTPAMGTSEQRIAEVRARLEGVTPGPWFVWDGVGYAGGGRDLCIGAGPTWLANMDHRYCRRGDEHMQVYASCELQGDADVCSLAPEITAEQIATANFIARAREDVPFLLATIDHQSRACAEAYEEKDRQREDYEARIDRLAEGRRVDKVKASAIFARLDDALRSDKEIRWVFGTLLGVDVGAPHPETAPANPNPAEGSR